jgi:uncharacterized protein (DUF1778 family)
VIWLVLRAHGLRVQIMSGGLPYNQHFTINITQLTFVSAIPNSARLEARLPANIHSMLKRAADLEGRSLTDFVVSAAHAAAVRSIESAELLRLSAIDQAAFAKALISPAKPNAALKRAFARQHQLITD